MNIILTFNERHAAAIQFATDRFNAERKAALSPEEQEKYVPVTPEELFQTRCLDVAESYASQKADEDIKRVGVGLKKHADTGEFLAKLADAVEAQPEALVQALAPALGIQTA